MAMRDYALVIYAITNDGRGRVKKFVRIPLGELIGGEYELPVRLFREDVVLSIGCEELRGGK